MPAGSGQQAGLTWPKYGFAATFLMVATVSLACSPGESDVDPTREALIAIVMEGLSAEDPLLRAETVRIAAMARDVELTNAIQERLDDRDLIVRASAIAAMIETNPEAILAMVPNLLANRDIQSRQALVDLLLSSPDAAVRRRTLLLALSDHSIEMRIQALQSLEQHPTEWLAITPQLVEELLTTESASTLSEAVRILLRTGHPEALDAVHAALVSDRAQARSLALQVLPQASTTSSWPHLRWLTTHGDDVERTWAVLGLAGLGDSSVLDEVDQLLRTGEERFLPGILRALSRIGDERARQRLNDFRTHNNPELREVALRGLIQGNYPMAELLELLGDPAPAIVQDVSVRLLETPPHRLGETICPSLRVATRPEPLLRFLWLNRTDLERTGVIQACESQIRALMDSQTPPVRSLAARLYFLVAPLDALPANETIPAPTEILYAFLEESALQQPSHYTGLYRRCLSHDLLAVRTLAAVGLLLAGS